MGFACNVDNVDNRKLWLWWWWWWVDYNDDDYDEDDYDDDDNNFINWNL